MSENQTAPDDNDAAAENIISLSELAHLSGIDGDTLLQRLAGILLNRVGNKQNNNNMSAVQRLDRYLREMYAIECCVVRYVSFDPDMKSVPTAEQIAAEMLQWFAAIDAGLLPGDRV